MKRILAMAGLLLAGCGGASPPAGEPVAGDARAGLPPIDAVAAHIEPSALTAAGLAAEAEGASALIVLRNDHVVLERYWDDAGASTPIAAGAWQGVLDDLLLGALREDRRPVEEGRAYSRAEIAGLAGNSYAAYLDRRLWRPLGAGEARLGEELHAAIGDWIRIGALLGEGGVYQGEQLVPPGWTAALLARRAPAPGDATYATRGVHRLAGSTGNDFWIVPSLRLVILRTGAKSPARAGAAGSTIPDLVIRGLTDRPRPQAEGAVTPSDVVPSH